MPSFTINIPVAAAQKLVEYASARAGAAVSDPVHFKALLREYLIGLIREMETREANAPVEQRTQNAMAGLSVD